MSQYVLSPRAQADLDDIWDYTEDRWGRGQAERYVRELQSAIEVVARDPKRARACDDLRAGYRRFSVGSHVVFVLLEDNKLQVVRVLHQSMDFDQHL